MSGNRFERRGVRDPEEYEIILSDPDRIAKPFMDENDRSTVDWDDFRIQFERLGYDVEIRRY